MTEGSADIGAWLPDYYRQALGEQGRGVIGRTIPAVCVYPYRWVSAARKYCAKARDVLFSFVGSLSAQAHHRSWVRDFAIERFDESSVYADTTRPEGGSLGAWDHTRAKGFRAPFATHRSYVGFPWIDRKYWSVMGRSRYALCPRGRLPWSLRVNESIVAGCVPVVSSPDDMWRTPEEQKVGMEFVLESEWEPGCGDGIPQRNWERFLDNHLLKPLEESA